MLNAHPLTACVAGRQVQRCEEVKLYAARREAHNAISEPPHRDPLPFYPSGNCAWWQYSNHCVVLVESVKAAYEQHKGQIVYVPKPCLRCSPTARTFTLQEVRKQHNFFTCNCNVYYRGDRLNPLCGHGELDYNFRCCIDLRHYTLRLHKLSHDTQITDVNHTK